MTKSSHVVGLVCNEDAQPSLASGAVLLEIISDPTSTDLPWPSLIETHYSASLTYLRAGLDWREGEGRAHWAARTEYTERLALAGRGAAALEAVAAGLILGARTILAVTPGEDEQILSNSELWSELAEMLSAPEWIAPGQIILIVVAEDVGHRELDVGARLAGLGARVEFIRPGLPGTTLPLALCQSGWMKAWLDAFVLGLSSDVYCDILAAWRRSVDLAIEVDPENAVLRKGVLHLDGLVQNRSDQEVDLDAIARDGVEIGARIASSSLTESLQIYVGLPGRRLTAGETAPVTLEIPASVLDEPQTTVKIGLVCRDRFWFGDFGFPETLLASSVPEETQSSAAAPTKRKAPPRARPAADLSPARATRRDVIEAYRTFLGREPESEAVIDDQLSGEPELWAFLRGLTLSPEALRWSLSRRRAHWR